MMYSTTQNRPRVDHVTAVGLALTMLVWASCSNNATSSEGGKAGQPSVAVQARPGSGVSTGGEHSGTPEKQVASSMPRLAGVHHSVFSLKDNRLLAHLLRADGLLVPLGYPGVAKYLNFRRPWNPWVLDQRLDGRRVALADKTVTWVHFPLDEAQARSSTFLILSLNSPKAQGLRIRLNDTKLQSARLSAGWQTVKITIPQGAARAGENRVELGFAARGRLGGRKAWAAVEWLYLGSRVLEKVSSVEPLKEGRLWLPKDGGLAYYIHPYKGTKLGLHFKSQAEPSRCQLKVRLTAKDQAPIEEVRSETALPPGSETETFVDLAPMADRVTRLELLAKGSGCKGMALSAAHLVRSGPAPRVKRGRAPKNVLFWMIDNARVDRYKLYNPETRVETPVIDKLGRTGTLFETAYIVGTESRVSHGSLWTGIFPKQTRFVRPKNKLPRAYVTLAEALKQGKPGLTTACWVANGNVSKFWGFAEGWDHFRNTLHKGGGLTAQALADHSIKFIQEKGDKPFYLYVGTIDPHVSWRGRQPWLDKYHPEPYTNGPFKKNVMGPVWDRLAGRPKSVPQKDRKRALAIYDSTVSYNDHHLGRVLKALERRGVRDETMIVITADHGEEFWEYGRIGHGGSCRETVVHVPLLIHYPPLFGKGVRIRQGVDVIGVMSTILDAVGAPIPDTVQAASMLPLAHGVGAGYPRPGYATQYELAHVIRLERFKLRVGGKGVPRLYELTSEEKEAKDVSATFPNATRWLTDALSTFLIYQGRWRQSRWGVFSNHLAALPEDLEQGKGPPPIRPR